MTRELKILKAVLLFRKINKYQSKEDQIAEADKYYTDEQLDQWIETLKEGGAFASEAYDPEDVELDYFADALTPTSTNRDYSPSNPWDAPGMSISDFI